MTHDQPDIFGTEGLVAYRWENGPDHRYGTHRHPYHKVLVCERGSITFHLVSGDVVLRSGDRFDLPPGTEHAATVGPTGVVCWEAARPDAG